MKFRWKTKTWLNLRHPWGAEMVQWWEHSPPTNDSWVRTQIGPGVICGLSLLLLYSARRGFSPGTPVFPSPQKPTVSNSNLILECTGVSNQSLWTPGAPWVNKINYITLLSVFLATSLPHYNGQILVSSLSLFLSHHFPNWNITFLPHWLFFSATGLNT